MAQNISRRRTKSLRNDLAVYMLSDESGLKVLVLDTSAIINLNATGLAAKILDALPNEVAVTTEVVGELKAGSEKDYDDWGKLRILLDAGKVAQMDLIGEELTVFRNLVGGNAPATLGDGEASTIAKATLINGIAVIDDRKAIKLALTRYDKTPILPTVALLLDKQVGQGLGRGGQIDAIYSALQGARMHVPEEYETTVLDLIGQNRAAQCPSLRRRLRRRL